MRKTTTPGQRYLKGLLAHDSKVIEEIYSEYSDAVRRLILKNNGSDSDAKDIFQDGLMAIYEQVISGLKLEDEKFGAYLYVVCRNTWLNKLKKQKTSKRVTFGDYNLYNDEEDMLVLAEQMQNKQRLNNFFWEKFRELGPRCCEMLRLVWAGNALIKVAEMMGIAYGYVRKKRPECERRLIGLIKKDPRFQQLQLYYDE